LEQRGLIVTCNRCGKQIILRYIGEYSLDGGLTKKPHFSLKPDSWSVEKCHDLCDECTKDYDSLWLSFIREKGRNL